MPVFDYEKAEAAGKVMDAVITILLDNLLRVIFDRRKWRNGIAIHHTIQWV